MRLPERAEVESRLGEEVNARGTLEQRLAEAESAGRDAERQHASELASLTARLADVEARHQAAMGQHAHDADELTRQLTAMRARAAALRRHAERVSVLERQLDESHKDNRRQFERAPYGLCECTREGVVTRVNHSLARMLGYRGTDLQRMDIAATIFESAADVQWLLERTLRDRQGGVGRNHAQDPRSAPSLRSSARADRGRPGRGRGRRPDPAVARSSSGSAKRNGWRRSGGSRRKSR